MNLIIQGNRRRTTEATNANQTSSRSHAVFQILVTSSPRTKNTQLEELQGKLSLIDLAGSERGTVTENRGIRLREGAKINRSLLALANCINALGDKTKKGFFVPYRDSKLTRLLKDSLGGNSKTVMIASISPAAGQVEETLNTLKYASRAKNIKTKAVSNKKLVTLHIAEYKNIITDLRQEIEQLKSKLTDGISGSPIQPESFKVGGYPQHSGNVSMDHGKESECPCWCGRVQDDIEMKKVQSEIFENFQERIQLRRALMELEEQNALNHLEIKRKQAEISVWQKNEGGSQSHPVIVQEQSKGGQDGVEEKAARKRPLSGMPKEMKQEFKNIQTLRMSTDQNTMKREMMNLQLVDNIGTAKHIREGISRRIKHKDKREFLEMVIRNHIFELQNIELEIHLQIQEKTINDLKNIIHSQKKVIEEHKIDSNINIPWDDNLSDGLSQNDSDDYNIEDIVYDDEGEDDNVEDPDLDALEYKEALEKGKLNSNESGNTSINTSFRNQNIAVPNRPGKNTSFTEDPTAGARSRARSKSRRPVAGHDSRTTENNYLDDPGQSNYGRDEQHLSEYDSRVRELHITDEVM